MRNVFEIYIPDNDELEAFGAWAFGKNYRELALGINFLKAWNRLHSHLFKIDPLGQIYVDAPKMVQIWKENR